MEKLGIIILAAGLGKRMKSALPKVLHSVCGKPLITYSLNAALSLNPEICCVVLGYKNELVKPFIIEPATVVLQEQQLGTGHAVMQASEVFKGFDGKVLILCGDVPLLKPATLKKLLSNFDEQNAAATVLTAEIDEPAGYGRIVRNADDGSLSAIVEDKDADKDIKQIKEINSGIYCFNSKLLFKYLPELKNSNAQGEYYLTDIIGYLVARKHKVTAVKTKNFIEIEGINDRRQLSAIEKELYLLTAKSHLDKGINIIDITNTYIDTDTKIGAETIIYPNTFISCSTIGKNCIIRSSSIFNSEIKDSTTVVSATVEKSVVHSNSTIDAYSVITESEIKQNSQIGCSNSIKNSRFGANLKIRNNCSIENLEAGKNCFFSNNVSVCGFDGINSHSSSIGDEVFVGAGCQIVSPVNIGADSYITSGAAINKDVGENCLIMSRPETIVKQGFVDKVKKKLLGGD